MWPSTHVSGASIGPAIPTAGRRCPAGRARVATLCSATLAGERAFSPVGSRGPTERETPARAHCCATARAGGSKVRGITGGELAGSDEDPRPLITWAPGSWWPVAAYMMVMTGISILAVLLSLETRGRDLRSRTTPSLAGGPSPPDPDEGGPL